MKRYLLLFLLTTFFCTAHVNAQESKYTIHSVTKGETLSGLALKYHVTVGDIMRLNGMNSKSQLKIGQKVKIPQGSPTAEKTTTAKTSTKTKTTKTDTVATTHYVMQNETLYSIAKKFGVSVEQLKEWNNLSDENVHFGEQLAVSADGAVVLAAKRSNAVTANPLNTPAPAVDNNPAQAVDQKNLTVPASTGTLNDGSDSYFAKDFRSGQNNELKTMTGYATVFKTTNGWKDKKYYILMNEVPSGTIVKVSSPNGNTIYAKVLWSLDDANLNYGLNFRINDAAASALAVGGQTFSLRVEYHQ